MEFLSERDMLISMVTKAQDYNLISLDEDVVSRLEVGELTQNQYILFLSVYAYILNLFQNDIREIYNDMSIDTATGAGLDNLGALFNIKRVLSQPALLELNVELPVASDTNITIPAGTSVLFEEIFMNDEEFIVSVDTTIPAGVTSTTVRAESVNHYFMQKIPENVVKGLAGFNSIVVTNPEPSTHGKNIEEDKDLRQRIKQWIRSNTKGTRACIEDYLAGYDGIDDFSIIPLFDGVGTLKIVCDTLPSMIPEIADDVYNNCMLITDAKPVIELPTDNVMTSINVYVTVKEEAYLTNEELIQLVVRNVENYINGGILIDGTRYAGLGIGESFNPSQLIRFLMQEVLDIENCYFTIPDGTTEKVLIDVVEIGATEKFKIDGVNVVIA